MALSLCEFLFAGIIAALRLCLSWSREVADPLQVSDDTGHIVNVLAVAVWTFLEESLVDMSAVVTDSVWNVECKVVASLFRSHSQQLSVLCLRQVLVEVHVQSRSAGQMFDIWRAMHLELVDDIQRVVLHHIEEDTALRD